MTPRLRAAAAFPFRLSHLLGVGLALLACTSLTIPARAATEEFSTFDLFGTEEDDESTIDHLLTATPPAWRESWERSRLAVRASQGCFTSGQWIVDSDVKLSTSIGGGHTFGVDDRRYEADDANYRYTDLWLRFRTPLGGIGGYFRPYHDKSRQDFGGFWETGNDSIGLQTRVVFTIEDAFNNFWAFRQTRVGDQSEPYEQHPYEAALHVTDREPFVRWELAGKWLTPSRQQVIEDPASGSYRTTTLWGVEGSGSAETRVLGLTWLGAGSIKQARSVDDLNAAAGQQGDRWRNAWGTDVGVRAALSRPRTTVDLHWLYRVRVDQFHPAGPVVWLDAIDRVVWLDSWTTLSPRFDLRIGGMTDRISITTSQPYPFHTYGSRRESRAYVGLTGRFGKLIVTALEGFEIDREPYDVYFVHDKGFISFQATF